jgi:hypothetical protein
LILASLDFPCTAFFPECLPNHCQDLRRTFSKICTNSDGFFNRPIVKSRLQIKGRKKSACPPGCMTFCILTPKIC